MDEPRDHPPGQEVRAPVVAASTRLSPVQESWRRFVRHVTRTCDRCRDIDETRCDIAEELYRAYQAADGDARRRLNGQSVLPPRQ